MSAIDQQQCPACGAPVALPPGKTQMYCLHCGTALAIDRAGGAPMLQLASPERPDLWQRRATVLREAALVRQRFDAVDAAVRPLAHRSLFGEDYARRERLVSQRAELWAHLGRLRAELAELDARLGPAAAASAPPSPETFAPPAPPVRVPPPAPRAGNRGLSIVLGICGALLTLGCVALVLIPAARSGPAASASGATIHASGSMLRTSVVGSTTMITLQVANTGTADIGDLTVWIGDGDLQPFVVLRTAPDATITDQLGSRQFHFGPLAAGQTGHYSIALSPIDAGERDLTLYFYASSPTGGASLLRGGGSEALGFHTAVLAR